MFKIFVSLIIISCFCYSCTKEKKENIDAPEAIKELILTYTDCFCDPYVDKYVWRGKTIYLLSCGGPACDCTTTYYNESGEKLYIDSSYTPGNFREEGQLLKHVWSCKQE